MKVYREVESPSFAGDNKQIYIGIAIGTVKG